MNIFSLCSDIFRLWAIVALIFYISKTQDCSGLSGKTQVFCLFALIIRLISQLFDTIIVYDTLMQLCLLVLTSFTVYLICKKFAKSHNGKDDMQYAAMLLLPCLVLSMFVNYKFTLLGVLQAFSIYLESIAIFPQLTIIWKTGKSASILVQYFLLLGMHVALYFASSLWLYYFRALYDLIAIGGGIVQMLLFCNFFYMFCTNPNLMGLEEDSDRNTKFPNP